MIREENSTEQAGTGFDTGIMVRGVLAPLIVWGIAVGVASWSGTPGVACATPMAWLIGLWVGNYVAARSRSHPSRRRIEALISGGVLGFLMGVLFYVVSTLAMPVRPEEEQRAVYISLGIIIFGTIITALLSLMTASARSRRASS